MIITKRGKPKVRLVAFPRSRRESDMEVLRFVAACAPFKDFDDQEWEGKINERSDTEPEPAAAVRDQR